MDSLRYGNQAVVAVEGGPGTVRLGRYQTLLSVERTGVKWNLAAVGW